MRIILNRADKIGDTIMALPTAGAIKAAMPDAEVIYAGRELVKPLIDGCEHIDRFVDWRSLEQCPEAIAELNADAIVHLWPQRNFAASAKTAGVPLRIGTSRRLFHLRSCNRLVNVQRSGSGLHQAQLDLAHLKPFGIFYNYSLNDIPSLYGLKAQVQLPVAVQEKLDPRRRKLIFHTLSADSAPRWPYSHWLELIAALPGDEWQILLTGTSSEAERLSRECPQLANHDVAVPLFGQVDLAQMLTLVDECDGLLASSTGPLHLAAALGKFALGFYCNYQNAHPQRWGALGARAEVLTPLPVAVVAKKKAPDCMDLSAISVATAADCIRRAFPD